MLLKHSYKNTYYFYQSINQCRSDVEPYLVQIVCKGYRTFVKSAYQKLIFLVLNQNLCCGHSKEPSLWDGSFEHPNNILKLVGKKIFTILL